MLERKKRSYSFENHETVNKTSKLFGYVYMRQSAHRLSAYTNFRFLSVIEEGLEQEMVFGGEMN